MSNALTPAFVSVPGADLGRYLAAVNGVAVLSADEERQLAQRYFLEQDVDPTCVSWCILPAATTVMACPWPTWSRKATSA